MSSRRCDSMTTADTVSAAAAVGEPNANNEPFEYVEHSTVYISSRLYGTISEVQKISKHGPKVRHTSSMRFITG